ncbi:Uncharacterized protein APZ42_015105 [Daphnia magna]|uniref:Uncharacterized protein n=1 Tax=Daphnia magna TaxID=35525 RepID=A0A162P612_9CRUS|nr:Uncharacterized protein APZ42_015105 [Daphnia magna]
MGHERTVREKRKGVVSTKNRLTCVPLNGRYDKKRKTQEKRHVSRYDLAAGFSYSASRLAIGLANLFIIKNPDYSRNVSYLSLLPLSHRFGESNVRNIVGFSFQHLIIWRGLENLKSICVAVDEFIASFRRKSYPTAY